nr:MAG TPA: hypothetical protein [Caudoviricetes sp.]
MQINSYSMKRRKFRNYIRFLLLQIVFNFYCFREFRNYIRFLLLQI